VTTENSQQLGDLIKIYRRKKRLQIYWIALLIASILFICAGLFAALESQRLGLYLLPAGMVILAFSSLVRYLHLNKRDYSVELFSNGFVYKKAGQRNEIIWSDIAEVYQDISRVNVYYVVRQTFYGYTLILQDTSRIKFSDSLKEIHELGDVIQREVTRHLLPGVFNRISEGGQVKFGPYAASTKALYFQGDEIPWEKIEKLHVNYFAVGVKTIGSWFNYSSIRTPKIPNLHIFIEVCKRYIHSDNPIEYG